MNDFDFNDLPDDFDFDKLDVKLPENLPKLAPVAPIKSLVTIKPDIIEHKIGTSTYLNGFNICGIFKKDKFNISKMKINFTQDNKLYRIYNEKQILKNEKRGQEIPKYSNYLFTSWQNDLIDYIHNKSNVILKIATSCGKTWATNSIISYYTLASSGTSLFIVPNSEILRENTTEILTKNKKTYLSGASNIIDTQTKTFSSYDERTKPPSQILCITSDNFINFITNDINIHFIKKLKYIVFDEVHLPEISNTYLWANLIPHTAQYILLSATINNVEELSDSIAKLSDNPINIINFDIRPIPLQRILINKDTMTPTFQVNLEDPTPRDLNHITKMCIGNLEELEKMPRNDFYYYAQDIIKSMAPDVSEEIERDIMNAVLEPTPINLYKIITYLLNNNYGPILVFGTHSSDIQLLVTKLVNYIKYLEDNDEEYCNAEKYYKTLEKKQKSEEQIDPYSKKAAKTLDDEDYVDYKMLKKLYKWKFPLFDDINKQIKNSNSWFNTALEYGIGVYTSNIKYSTRHLIYTGFKENKIKIMFADSSLAVGINLPIRTCILTGEINPILYKQMGGRAGRRGLDTKGYILPMFNKELVKKCILYKDDKEDKINLKLMLSYLDITKLLIPNVLATYYFTAKKNKERKIKKYENEIKKLQSMIKFDEKQKHNILKQITQLEGKILKCKELEDIGKIQSHDEENILCNIKKDDLQISELRKGILNKYIDLKLDDRINTKIDYIKSAGLNYHILSNIIQMADNIETVIFIMALINGDLEYINNENEMIDFLSTLIYRNKGDKLLLNEEILDKIETYKNQIKIAESKDKIMDTNYKEPINDYLYKFFTYQTFDYEYLNNIIGFGQWFYLILKYIKRIAPNSYKLRDIIINTDKKYIYSTTKCGISPIKN